MKQIGIDFQGWPINALTLREILERLGFKEDDKTITLIKDEDTNKLLDAYPLLLEDDGMAYGINPMYVIECDKEVYTDEDSNLEVFNLFRERATSKT